MPASPASPEPTNSFAVLAPANTLLHALLAGIGNMVRAEARQAAGPVVAAG